MERISGVPRRWKFGKLPTEILENQSLTTHEKLLMGCLLWHGEGEVFPGRKRLALLMSCSLCQVSRAIQGLSSKLSLRVVRETGGVNRYDMGSIQDISSPVTAIESYAVPPATPTDPKPAKKRTPEQIALMEKVDAGLKTWDQELKNRGFAVPARVWGRDRALFSRLVRAYGVPEVAATMRKWLDYRKTERLDATIVGFYAAFERTWQRRHAQ